MRQCARIIWATISRYEISRFRSETTICGAAKSGGARRNRTADLLHAMQALSQLSYGP